jgi:hypothetical protein
VTDLAPILVAGFFREINGHLGDLLRSLAPEDWHRPTGSSQRNVKGIASHLLDGRIGLAFSCGRKSSRPSGTDA